MATFLNDYANIRQGGYSIQPGSSRGNDGDVNGSWVDLSDTDGTVHAECGVGDTGEGGTYKIDWKLQEADDSSGTNSQDISGATAAISDDSAETNDETSVAITTGQRSKPFVRVVATIDITGGSSSGTDIPVAATVFGIKKHS